MAGKGKGVLQTLKETIHIYHTNDVHSHFEHWPKVVHYLRKKRSEHKKQNEHMVLLDIGDFIDRFHPITEASDGKANVTLLNDAAYDAVTIGNNEGITLSHKQLDTLYAHAKFPVIVANVFYENGERPHWMKPYVIMTFGCVRVAFIGVTVPFQTFYELLGWRVADPFETVAQLVEELSEKVDAIVLLSHLGVNDDEKMAEMFPQLTAILGGHTHHVFEQGKWVNETLLCGAGKFGHYVGHVTLTIDQKSRKVDMKAHVQHTEALEYECEETKQKLNDMIAQSARALAQPIVQLPETLHIDWFAPSPLATILAQALNEWCEGDVAMVNAGVLLSSLEKGVVTKGDIHRICPHPINPCKVYLRGSELKEVILQAETEQMKQLRLKGFGFRGEVMGQMVYDRITVEKEQLIDGQAHVRRIFINHQLIDEQKTYAVATIDMFTFGHLYPEIYRAKKQYYMPEMLRDVLAWKLKNMYER